MNARLKLLAHHAPLLTAGGAGQRASLLSFRRITGKSKSQINRRLAEPKPHVVANGAGEPQPTEKHQGLVVEIRRHLRDAQKAQVRLNQCELAACRSLQRLRHTVEAEGKNWWEWYESADIGHSREEAERLMKIEKVRTLVIGDCEK